ncbi:MAG: 1-hydroxycarotenoid 3,4-desaturase CrtD [Bacteroidota bacterium]
MSNALVIGAGVGGIATAIRLQLMGYQVAVYEKNGFPGGKLSEFRLGDYRFDAGPSLFTLPEQVDALFELAGKNPRSYFRYQALPVITRYFYPDGTRLDAFQDPEAFAVEVEQKTGEPAEKIRKLLRKSEKLYEITGHIFLERSLHKFDSYWRKETLQSALQLHKLDAFRSMHKANTATFNDQRIVQLFDRYATYNGSNPYQAPATLSIIPHLEHNLGAYFPEGGMYDIVKSLVKLAEELGVSFHYKQDITRILHQQGKVIGIQTSAESIYADLVVSNADIHPTYTRLLPDLSPPTQTLKQAASSSALIFYWGMDRTFPDLDVHNIFFSGNYQAEFEAIWKQQSIYEDPTVYLYSSSKHCQADAPAGHENWFVMINVPADTGQDWAVLKTRARAFILDKLEKMMDMELRSHIQVEETLDPTTIASRTSSHQGALYGNSSNNMLAAFLRHPNFSRKLKGLYFCGGSVHPGGGIPLCLLSAKITADLVRADRLQPVM